MSEYFQKPPFPPPIIKPPQEEPHKKPVLPHCDEEFDYKWKEENGRLVLYLKLTTASRPYLSRSQKGVVFFNSSNFPGKILHVPYRDTNDEQIKIKAKVIIMCTRGELLRLAEREVHLAEPRYPPEKT